MLLTRAQIGVAVLACWLPTASPASGQEPKTDPPGVAERADLRNLRAAVAGERARILEQLADTLASREASVQEAEADLRRAQQRREAAGLALKVYVEGVYIQDKLTLETDLHLAQSDRQHAAEELANLRAIPGRGQPVSAQRLEVATLEDQTAQFTVEQAEVALQILERYERERNVKLLGAKIDEARQSEQTAQLQWDQRRKARDHRRQLADDARTRVPEDLLAHLLDRVVQGEAELARLTREASEAHEQVSRDPTLASARTRVEELRQKIQAQVEATRTTLRDAVELADETANLRQRYADAEKRLIAARKTSLGLPTDPMKASPR